MHNLFENIRDSLVFNKFRLNDLVCVEYTCPVEDDQVAVYTQTDYLVHVLSGKKSWKTTEGEWTIETGDTLFVKKGAAIVTQDFEDEYCMLGFFLPDNLIRESLQESVREKRLPPGGEYDGFTAARLDPREFLTAFFQSMYPYFQQNQAPPDTMLKLKLKELLINILFHGGNPMVSHYLKSVVLSTEPSLSHIMETNFLFNLKLEEFAKMCHRSLSKFKRDFTNHYDTTPGKWLLEKRLNHAAGLLWRGELNITQVAFESGFRDVSHFSKKFKDKFGSSPSHFAESTAL